MAATITLDSGTTYQTISGWEGTANIGHDEYKNDFLQWQQEVLDLLAYDLGINRVRLELRIYAENTTDYFQQYLDDVIDFSELRTAQKEAFNDNADPDVINAAGFQFTELDYDITYVVGPMRTRLAAMGESLFVNLSLITGTPSDFRHSDDADEYAELMLAAFEHMDDTYGWVPDQIEIVNEPSVAKGWSATKIGDALVATATKLSAAGFNPDFCAPSTVDMADAISWFDTLIAISGVTDDISEISYHRYAGVSQANREAIASRANTYGLRVLQGEKFDGGGDYVALYEDLVEANAASWQQYVLAFPTVDNGAQYYYMTDPGTPVVAIGNLTKYLRQYFKFIRSGAERIGATSDNGNFDPVAFVNANGQYVVVINAAVADVAITVENLPKGHYGIRYTTAGGHDQRHTNIITNGGNLVTSIPAAGVLTVYNAQDANTQNTTDTTSSNEHTVGGVTVTVNIDIRTTVDVCVDYLPSLKD